MADGPGDLVNKAGFCSIMAWTRQVFDRHVRDGMPVADKPTDKGGEYKVRTAEAIRWLIARAVEASGGDEGQRLDANVELARLRKEQADKTAMENARSRNELLPADRVSLAVTSAFGRVRSRLLAIPPKAAPRLVDRSRPTEIQAALSDYVEEALRELSETQVIGECSDGLAYGDEPGG